MTAHQRLHALDGLRAVMMLLGLLLHSIVSYGAFPYGAAWPFKDQATSPLMDLLVFGIHIFRMPIFFVMAGFFSALLYLRRGPGGLAQNRFTRIVLPFAVGWLVLHPLVVGGFTFANTMKAAPLGVALSAVGGVAQSGALFVSDTTMHLWFLYDLILFYVAALILAPLAMRLPESVRSSVMRLYEAVVSRPLLRPLPLAILTAITLWPMGGVLKTATSFVPDPAPLVAYGVFFGFGWLLYLKRELLPSFDRLAWTQIAIAIALVPLNNWSVTARTSGAEWALWLTMATGGLVVWLLTFGITGLFLRYLDRPAPVVRYVVDASYWLYLVHLPFTIWIPGLLTELAWPAVAKAAVVLAGTTVVGFATYDLLVRPTFIGAVLNGRRYPRGLPAHEHAPAPSAGLQPS